MTSIWKRKAAISRALLARCTRRTLFNEEVRLWDEMPAVGREFGSPDFERLMEEDHRSQVGVFDPELKVRGALAHHVLAEDAAAELKEAASGQLLSEGELDAALGVASGPQYEADDGPLTAAQLRWIKKIARQRAAARVKRKRPRN